MKNDELLLKAVNSGQLATKVEREIEAHRAAEDDAESFFEWHQELQRLRHLHSHLLDEAAEFKAQYFWRFA